MKCKVCGKKINLTVFGMPDDICWDCFDNEGKKEVLDVNVGAKLSPNKVEFDEKMEHFAQKGISIWGKKTLVGKDSTLGKVHIKRLFGNKNPKGEA